MSHFLVLKYPSKIAAEQPILL